MIGHVAGQFSAALDGDLGAGAEQRFQAHLERCARCAADYAVFRRGVESLRAAPPARMPQPVHIPHAAPTSNAGRAARRWAPRMLPAFGGGATLVAAAIAVLLLIVGHGAQRSLSTSTSSGAAAQPASPAQSGPCVGTVPVVGAPAAPARFQHVVTATSPSRPGEELVLATPASSVRPGSSLQIYAALLSSSGSAPTHVTSCIRISGIHGTTPAVRPGAQPLVGGVPTALLLLPVPAAAPAGSEVRIEVTVAAGSPHPGAQSLTTQLSVTVSG